MKPLVTLFTTIAVGIGSTSVSAQDVDVSMPSGLDLQRSEAVLRDLETQLDNLDLQLAEPLLRIADRQSDLGAYEEAHYSIDRAMQIVRINDGLFTPRQIPLLKMKINNLARWGNWDSARDQLEHFYWLARHKIPVGEALIDDFLVLSDMHLQGVTGDSEEFRTYHLRRAESANRWALLVAEAVWGADSARLSPILYKLVKNYHIQAAALQGGGQVAYELRQVTPGANLMRDRIDARRYYYFSGLRYLRRINAILEQADPADLEGEAMSRLYLADWQVLFGRHEEALQNYQLAYQGLQAAGIEEKRLEAFFANPTLVPEQVFYPTLDSALAARETAAPGPLSQVVPPGTGNSLTLFFSEWSPAIPFVQPPIQSEPGPLLDSNFALFSFNLAGIGDLTRWLSDRNKQQFASVVEARLMEPKDQSPDREQWLLQRLESLRFRPRLVGGIPQESAGTLMYQLAGEFPQ